MYISPKTKKALFLLAEAKTDRKIKSDIFYIVKKYGILIFFSGSALHWLFEKMDAFFTYRKWIHNMKKHP